MPGMAIRRWGSDPEGLAACAAGVEGLDRLSRERVGAEIKKLLAAPDPAPAMAALAATGGLSHVLPGADPRMLAPLVHLESEAGVAPDPLRRLAALGGEAPVRDLRLSRAEAKRLAAIAAATASALSPAAGRLSFRCQRRDRCRPDRGGDAAARPGKALRTAKSPVAPPRGSRSQPPICR